MHMPSLPPMPTWRDLLDKSHPVWKVLANLSVLVVILGATASNFDGTELKTLLLYVVGAGTVERVLR